MGDGEAVTTNDLQLRETLTGIEYGDFLARHRFELRHKIRTASFSCTVVDNGSILIAFTYQPFLGENFHVASRGADVSEASILSEGHGWFLLADLCPDEFRSLQAGGFPSDRKQQIYFFTTILEKLMKMIDAGKIRV